MVGFRWRRHPRTFAVRVPLTPDSPWTGAPFTSAQDWAYEVALLLMEELDTGAACWAQRRERDGRLELLLEAGPPRRSACWVSRAAAGRLCGDGFDTGPALRAAAEGRLAWLMTSPDSAVPRPVLGNVVVEEAGGGGRVSTLELRDGLARSDAVALGHAALCEAAEAGAERITSAGGSAVLLDAGLRSVPRGGLALDTTGPFPVPAAVRPPATPTLVRLEARCRPSGRDGRTAHFAVDEVALLNDGRTVALSDGHGWSSRPVPSDAGDLVRSTLTAVLPDEAQTTGDDHPWAAFVRRLRAAGLDVTVDDGRRIPYEVVLMSG